MYGAVAEISEQHRRPQSKLGSVYADSIEGWTCGIEGLDCVTTDVGFVDEEGIVGRRYEETAD